MAYNEKLVDRIRESMVHIPNLEEKQMFGGVCFMVNDKMCVGVVKDEMMCRIDPSQEATALAQPGCRPMDFGGRYMKGYVYVSEEGLRARSELDYWVGLCLDFNDSAKSSKKKPKKGT